MALEPLFSSVNEREVSTYITLTKAIHFYQLSVCEGLHALHVWLFLVCLCVRIYHVCNITHTYGAVQLLQLL